MNARILIGLAVLATSVATQPAHAVVYTATYTGTVAASNNPLNLFGWGDPVGEPFIAVFTYKIDSYQGFIHYADSTFEYVQGGFFYASPSPTTGLWMKIGSIGASLPTQFSNRILTLGGRYFQNLSYEYSGPSWYSLNMVLDTTEAPTRVTTPFSATGLNVPGMGCGACDTFTWHQYGAAADTNMGFNVTRLVVTSDAVSPVPESATWALMCAGLAMVGAAVRRRLS